MYENVTAFRQGRIWKEGMDEGTGIEMVAPGDYAGSIYGYI